MALQNVSEGMRMSLVLYNELVQSTESLNYRFVEVLKRRVNEMVNLLNEYCTVLNLPQHITDEIQNVIVDLLEQFKQHL